MKIETPMGNRLEGFLDVVAKREQLVASNIANIDTPGYRTKDIDFRAELQRAQQGEPGLPAQPQEVTGLLERPDGNNVSLDRESMLLAQTQLQFHTGIALLQSEFHQIATAINDGRTS